MPNSPQISSHRFDLQALAQDIAQRLQAAVQARGQAVLCVSGGQSPIVLFQALRVLPLAWHQVSIGLVDERCVASQHEASNAQLVRLHLLQDLAAAATLVPLIAEGDDAGDKSPGSLSPGSLSPPQVAARAATLTMRQLGAADVLVLGMGTDGHTASLFPEAVNLPEALDPTQTPACVAIELAHPPANAPYARVSQNLSMLLTARHIVLPVTGADKLAVLDRALLSKSLALPISHVLHQSRAEVAVWRDPPPL
jgi:6-phosphogluconolactonase